MILKYQALWTNSDMKGDFSPKLYFLQGGQAKPQEVAFESLAKDRELWRSVQATISNVTQSYGTTYSLNTVVSDLMTLTNTIAEYNDLNVDQSINKTLYKPDYRLSLHATRALIQMMAPITPAFSEECWRILNSDAIHSVFASPFPIEDGTFDLLAPTTRTCVVQVNGKMKCVVKIPIAEEGLAGEQLKEWLTERILTTDEGREKLLGSGRSVDVRKARKMIVIKEGKTVNFVM